MSIVYTGQRVSLRRVAPDDVTHKYVGWLMDPLVNCYLETRWEEQTIETVTAFVESMLNSRDNHLLAIIENFTSQHIGNVKIGPVNRHHKYADLSYFIGNRGSWNKGMATDAINGAVRFAFNILGLHTLRAGVYADNHASQRVLEKCGFIERGAFPDELVADKGRQAHVLYSLVNPT